MPYTLGPVATKDSYQDTTTRRTTVECARVTLFVANAPIQFELYLDDNWTGEVYLPSAAGATFAFSFDRRCLGFRARSAVAGSPATISVQLIPQSELPDA